MEIASIEVLPEGGDAAVGVYRCSGCDGEMRLTIWATFPSPSDSLSSTSRPIVIADRWHSVLTE